MRICLYSNAYAPRCGGIESVSASLAAAWQKAGHQVLLVTDTPAEAHYDADSPFPVLRHPTAREWRGIARDRDVIVSNGYSLKHLHRWLMLRVPFWWIHQMYLAWDNPIGVSKLEYARWKLRKWLRPWPSWLGRNVYISRAMKDRLKLADGAVIYNPIDDRFRPLADVPRAADIGFFGRMWLAKGQDTLLHAIRQCRDAGHPFTACFYGDGEHLQQIKVLATELKLDDLVTFHPPASGEELVRAMNSAGIVAVPSTWVEPMGIVAVEAMACGKCVVGTNQGGLGEVLTGWMPTFDNGNVEQLRDWLIRLLTDPAERQRYEAVAVERAKSFSCEHVAQQYIDLFQQHLGPAKVAVPS